MNHLRSKLRRLEARWAALGRCPGGVTMLLTDGGDGPPRCHTGEPFDPDRAARCRLCGAAHVVVVREVLVSPAGPEEEPPGGGGRGVGR